MFIKIPIYIDVRGPVQDPSLIRDAVRILLEKKLLSGKPEKKFNFPIRNVRDFKDAGIDVDRIFLISTDMVLSGLR